ncbi:hypothetical protein POUND7_010208 [Theobroma cacao]
MATTAASTASRGWLSNLSSMSSRIYFFLIILQIPLFSFTYSHVLASGFRLFGRLGESHGEVFPYEWYEKSFSKLTRLAHFLKDVDLVDGRLVNVNDDSIIIEDHIEHKMRTFKSLARIFIGSPSVQLVLKKHVSTFGKPSEREPMIVNSLTKVSNVLNVTAQQRKLVRLKICPQITQHRIWTGAIEKILNELKSEIDLLNCQFPSKGTKMGGQIVSSCLKFLAESAVSYDPDSASWMRLSPAKVVDPPSRKWDDVLEMFTDLINCLKSEKGWLYHATKIEIMKEGLSQIKDVLVDNSIGYKDARHQESLVRDIEVDLNGAIYGNGSENRFTLCMGRILTSNEEKMFWSGVKQLDRALGLFKFVWETAGMKGILELQGHLWCVGSEERIPCRSGMCSTPIHVTSSQLIASDVFPVAVVKALLFPGAITNGLVKNMTVPSWDNLLNIYNLTSIKEASAVPDLQRLEVLAGSYFCVAGALVGLLKPGRMSMFGTLLVIWGLVKEGILGKPANSDPTKAVYVYPTMLIALICALTSIKYDVKKVMRTAPARPIAKPLKSSSKSKLK